MVRSPFLDFFHAPQCISRRSTPVRGKSSNDLASQTLRLAEHQLVARPLAYQPIAVEGPLAGRTGMAGSDSAAVIILISVVAGRIVPSFTAQLACETGCLRLFSQSLCCRSARAGEPPPRDSGVGVRPCAAICRRGAPARCCSISGGRRAGAG